MQLLGLLSRGYLKGPGLPFSSAASITKVECLGSRLFASLSDPLNEESSASPTSSSKSSPPRFYSQAAFYKGKGALQLTIVPCVWRSMARPGSFVIEREGALLLSFAASNPSKDPKAVGRSYNWDQKITIALKGMEIGSIIAPETSTLDLYHDPDKGGENSGAVHKKLSMSTQQDGNRIFNATMNDTKSGSKHFVSISLTPGEFQVLKTVGQHAIPIIYGFDTVVS